MFGGNMDNEVMSADLGRDNEYDKSLRPKELSEFIGQKVFIDNLKVYIQASKRRNEELDHIIISGPPGLGKTT